MPKNHPELTAERLRELLSYDPNAGQFRRQKKCETAIGSIAGSKCGLGYIRISVDGRRYYAHRLAWLYIYGKWPTEEVDHINGVRDDNGIENLRQATHAENQQNRALRRDNTSGYTGVRFHPLRTRKKRWTASISIEGKRLYLGNFETEKEAVAAYATAKEAEHKFQPVAR